MSSCVIDESALSLIPVTATPQRHLHARLRAGRVSPPSTSRTRATPKRCGHMSGKSEVPAEHIVAHLNAAVIGNRVPQKPIPACRAATCAARAKRQPNQPARSIVLRSYGKTPAARLGRRPERRHRTGSPRRLIADALCGGCDVPNCRGYAFPS